MFREYAQRRLIEDMGLAQPDVSRMILRSLGADPSNMDSANNTPLSTWDNPDGLISRFNSLNSLSRLISGSPAAMQAIQNSNQTKLTVGQLAGILVHASQEQ